MQAERRFDIMAVSEDDTVPCVQFFCYVNRIWAVRRYERLVASHRYTAVTLWQYYTASKRKVIISSYSLKEGK